jgi:hypothetical protein
MITKRNAILAIIFNNPSHLKITSRYAFSKLLEVMLSTISVRMKTRQFECFSQQSEEKMYREPLNEKGYGVTSRYDF